MKVTKFIIACVFYCSLICNSFANNLVISGDLSITYEKPSVIAHLNDLIVIKYDDWSFSHEIINPNTFYSDVNLTGIEHTFISSLFDEKLRDELPSWGAAISSELSQVMLPKSKTYTIKTIQNNKIYECYNDREKLGSIFILENNQIHRLSIMGEQDNHQEVLKAIKIRS